MRKVSRISYTGDGGRQTPRGGSTPLSSLAFADICESAWVSLRGLFRNKKAVKGINTLRL